MRSRLFLPHPPATDGNARAAPTRLGTCLCKRSATCRHAVVHLHASRRDVRQSLDHFVVHLGTLMSTLGTSMSTRVHRRHASVHSGDRMGTRSSTLGHAIGTSISVLGTP